MANALGTLAGSLVLQEALSLVFTKRPILRSISYGFQDRDGQTTAKWNQTVYTRTRTVATVNDFGTGATDRADTDVPVILDHFKEIHHAFTPQEYTSTDRDLIRESAEPIAVAFANHMVDAIAANWTVAHFGAGTVKAAGWDYDWLVDLRKSANAAGIPEPGRFLVANGDVYASLLKDSMIVAALNNPQNASAIASGRLPDVQGFSLQEYPSLGVNGENRVGFYGSPESVVYACRAPRNPEELLPNAQFPGVIGYVTEPTTGLTWMVNQWIDPSTLKANTRIVWMYGSDVGNSAVGDLVVTA